MGAITPYHFIFHDNFVCYTMHVRNNTTLYSPHIQIIMLNCRKHSLLSSSFVHNKHPVTKKRKTLALPKSTLLTASCGLFTCSPFHPIFHSRHNITISSPPVQQMSRMDQLTQLHFIITSLPRYDPLTGQL
jgi:hypothetical protein